MKCQLVKGTTSYIAQIFIRDSSSATGGGLTGLAFNTASLTAYYHRDTDTTATAISLVTMTVGTFTSSGFKEIDATNMPGWYQLCPPNAALASGAKSVAIHLKGATNMAPLPLEIELTGTDNQDAIHGGMSALPNTACTTNASLLTSGTGTDQLSVSSGRIDAGKILGTAISTPATAGVLDVNVKNMNNVAATSITTINANQGTTQPINFTGTGASALAKSDMVDIAGAAVSTSSAQIGVNAVNIGGTAQTGRDIGASVLLSAGTGTGQLDFTSGVVKANLAQILGTALTETAGQIAAAFKKLFDVASPVFTATSVNQTGDSYARLGAPAGASVSADIAAVKSDSGAIKTQTDKLTFTVANQIDANVLDWKSSTAPAMTGDAYARLGAPAGASVSADIAAVKADTGTSGSIYTRIGAPAGASVSADIAAINTKTTNLPASPAAVGSAMTLTSAYDFAKGTVAMTESYASDGSAPSPVQALMAIQQFQQEKNISSTTVTVNKVDGSTPAMTFTLDSATSPATITRAT